MPTPSGSIAGAANFEYGAVVSQSAASAGVTSGDQQNPTFRGIKVVVNITAISGTTPTLTVTLQGKDLASGTYYTLLASAALNATGQTVLTVYPGLTASANVTANDIVPRTFHIVAAIGGTTPSVTYTVGVCGVV
jgi:hypothetical protein